MIKPGARLFFVLFAVFAVVWVVCYAMVLSNPVSATMMMFPMMISGWGAGLFFILAIVFLVLRRM